MRPKADEAIYGSSPLSVAERIGSTALRRADEQGSCSKKSEVAAKDEPPPREHLKG